jgi:hypothetical protein
MRQLAAFDRANVIVRFLMHKKTVARIQSYWGFIVIVLIYHRHKHLYLIYGIENVWGHSAEYNTVFRPREREKEEE